MPPPTVLFLGANGRDTTRLRLGAEVREIRHELQAAGIGEAFRVATELAVRPTDLQSLLLQHVPTILHFSGHGSAPDDRMPDRSVKLSCGSSRDFVNSEDIADGAGGGLLLENDQGAAVAVRPGVLAALLAIVKRDAPLRCVLLNACFTASQAQSIAEHVDCVIGTVRDIEDRSAIAFSTAFYRAIAHNKSIGTAFELSRLEIELRGLLGNDAFRLFHRPQVEPQSVFVVDRVPVLDSRNEPLRARTATNEEGGGSRPNEMAGPLLSQAELLEVHRAVLVANLMTSRAILFACINETFVAAIPTEATPEGQMLRDLHEMNRTHRLADGTIPFAMWLRNAIQLAKGKNAIDAFARAMNCIEDLARRSESHSNASSVAQNVEELIETLDNRAQHIRNKLIGTYGYGPVREFLTRFDRLHAEHLAAVREGFFLRALDLCDQIHRLSYGNRMYGGGTREFIDYENERLSERRVLRMSAPCASSDPAHQPVRVQQIHLSRFYVPEFLGEHNRALYSPVPGALVNGTDGAAYALILQKVIDARRRQRDFEWQQARRAPLAPLSDPEHMQIQAAFRENGSRCPHCHEPLTDFKVVGKTFRFYVCGACRRSFDKPEG